MKMLGTADDRYGEERPLGFTTVKFKVATEDTHGSLFLIEHDNLNKGGPPRHFHPDQDEWFYVMQGELLVEIGEERMRLHAGDSVIAPRKVPHVWAFVGETPGAMLVGWTPAGKMEAFFREITKVEHIPQNAELFHAHGMEMVGPPLPLD